MCEVIEKLNEVAETLIKQPHEEIGFDLEDSMSFVNAVATLQEHATYIVNSLTAHQQHR